MSSWLITRKPRNIVTKNNSIVFNNISTNTIDNPLNNSVITTTNYNNIDILEKCLNLYTKTVFSDNGKYCAFLLESRYTDNIELILKQISRFLDEKWSVILFVTDDIYDKYITLTDNLSSNIKVKKINYTLNNVTDYNNILLDLEFWENNFTSFDKVLIFQTDTMMFNHGIENFYDYDYIGAPWPDSLSKVVSVGNGGFSLRSVKATIDCLKNRDNISIDNYLQYDINENKLGGQPEDIIFSYGMLQLGYNVPPVEIAKYFSQETINFNDKSIGAHRLDYFNKSLYDKLLNNSIIPYNLSSNPNIDGHRLGWNYVVNNLINTFVNKNGVYFDSWLDCNYLFNDTGHQIIPHNYNWVGITHLTPVNTNTYFSKCNISKLIFNKQFKNNLKTCKGLFTLSKYAKKCLESILLLMGYSNIPVVSLYHPIDIIEPLFDINNLSIIDTVISLGSQLRKNSTIFKLKTHFKKIWLSGRSNVVSENIINEECKEFNIILSNNEKKSVNILNVDTKTFDSMLINSFIIIDLYDASANNSLIECISRNIPCFVSNLPAIKEYIGDDYPLLFNNIEELEIMLNNIDLIKSAYIYLIDRPYLKERLKIDNFIKDILNSEITKNLNTVIL
jgi:hypothetical protein